MFTNHFKKLSFVPNNRVFAVLFLCLAYVAQAQMVPVTLNTKSDTFIMIMQDHVAPSFKDYRDWGNTELIWLTDNVKLNGKSSVGKYLKELIKTDDKNLIALIIYKNEIVERINMPTSPREIKDLFEGYKNGLSFSNNRYGVQLNKRVGDGYESYSGLLVFWRGGCPNCQAEKASLQALCKSKTLQITVIQTKDEGEVEGCVNKMDPRLAKKWGIEYVPTLAFLKQGRLGWLDVGYRGDLPQVASALAVLQKEMP